MKEDQTEEYRRNYLYFVVALVAGVMISALAIYVGEKLGVIDFFKDWP